MDLSMEWQRSKHFRFVARSKQFQVALVSQKPFTVINRPFLYEPIYFKCLYFFPLDISM